MFVLLYVNVCMFVCMGALCFSFSAAPVFGLIRSTAAKKTLPRPVFGLDLWAHFDWWNGAFRKIWPMSIFWLMELGVWENMTYEHILIDGMGHLEKYDLWAYFHWWTGMFRKICLGRHLGFLPGTRILGVRPWWQGNNLFPLSAAEQTDSKVSVWEKSHGDGGSRVCKQW